MTLWEKLLCRFDGNEAKENAALLEENHLSVEYLSRSRGMVQHNSMNMQEGSEIICHSEACLVDCYSSLIVELIKSLPLSSAEIDHMVLPMVGNLIDFVHLLPASEVHHHSTAGGLLTHLLEGATFAVRLAEGVSFTQSKSLKKKYEQKAAWITAAAITFLTHDLGKVGDMVISSRDGEIWNPELESLVAWSNRLQIRRYCVFWRSERQHKAHELRSLRYAYMRVLPKPLLDYLGERGEGEILDAMERAIIFNEGVLATILQRADARSVQSDIESNRRSQSLLSRSSPVVVAILSAIKELVLDGFWKTNCRGATVFVTDQGLFVVIRNETVRDIREHAVAKGLAYVPGTAAGVLKVLDEAGLLLSRDEYAPSSEGRELYWQFWVGKSDSGTFQRDFLIRSCICFPDPTQVLTADSLPQPLLIEVQTEEKKRVNEAENRGRNKEGEQTFVAPDSDFLPKTKKESDGKDSANYPDARESRDIPLQFLTHVDDPMSTEEVKDFLTQLTNLLIEHMRIGGTMAVDVHKDPDGNVRCKSIKFEEILTNKKVARNTVEIYLRLRKDKPRIIWDANGGFLILCSDKD